MARSNLSFILFLFLLLALGALFAVTPYALFAFAALFAACALYLFVRFLLKRSP